MAADVSRRARRRPAAQRGVALIEVMVGLLIFLVGVLGIVGLQAKAIQFTVQAEDRSRAALLANELVSKMWAEQSAALSDKTMDDWKLEVAEALPDASTKVSTENGVTTVLIRWKSPKAAKPPKDAKADDAGNQYITKVAL